MVVLCVGLIAYCKSRNSLKYRCIVLPVQSSSAAHPRAASTRLSFSWNNTSAELQYMQRTAHFQFSA